MMMHSARRAVSLLQRQRQSLQWVRVSHRPIPTTTTSTRWFATKRQQRAAAHQQQAAAASAAEKTDTTDTSPSSSLPKEPQPKQQHQSKKPSSLLIKTDLSKHVEEFSKPSSTKPSFYADESGIVPHDLTEDMIDLTDMYDKRLHFDESKFDSAKWEASTPLSSELIQWMAVSNRPITTAEYMRQALTHPQHGYYTNPSANDDIDDDDWDNDDDWDKDEEPDTSSSADHIIGPTGDFVTAPEISQIFGEMVAVWFITQWHTMGKPPKVQLVEVGPGKGTLISDIMKSCLHFDRFEDFGSTIGQIHLVETSPAMRTQQKERLEQITNAKWVFEEESSDEKKDNRNKSSDAATSEIKDTDNDDYDKRPTIRVTWHDSFTSVLATTTKNDETMPALVVSQEFIDALPVHVFEKTKEGWRERLVDVAKPDDDDDDNKDSSNKDDYKPVWQYKEAKENLKFTPEKKPRLRFVVAPDTTPALRTLLNVDSYDDSSVEVGQVCEVCPEGILLVQDIRALISQQGGAALIIDYGQEGSGDSLRGFSQHKQVHVLSKPGLVDVTADVDYEALRHAVNHHKDKFDVSKRDKKEDPNPPQAFGPVKQGQFLVSMGITERVSSLIEDDNTTDEQAEDLYNALERLVLPEHMGERYKVMAIARKKDGVFAPPGF